MSTKDYSHNIPYTAEVLLIDLKSVSEEADEEEDYTEDHLHGCCRRGIATTQSLCVNMIIYTVNKRNLAFFCTVILLLGLIIVLQPDNFVSYSNFKYPMYMDFTSKYEEFIQHGIQPSHETINPHPFEYIHRRSGCKFKAKGTPTLLILVKSAVYNFHLRNAIRETWGNVMGGYIEIVYLLAYRKALQPEVNKEMISHGDIIQESFLDAYMNNTYKTIMGFNWAVKYCSEATHIVFVDDDHYLNIRNVLNFIHTLGVVNSNQLMVGHLHDRSGPYRSRFSKWYISPGQYPFRTWPPYLAGAVYMVSQEVARKMVFAFPYVKYIGIDDTYLGIVASKIGIKPQHDERFVSPSYSLYTDPSQIVYGEFKKTEDFRTIQHILKNVDVVKMCALTWKCQFVFLL